MPETYVVFVEADRAAAELIAREKGYLLYLIIGEEDPGVYNLTLDENNLILVGGSAANPYSRYYFFDTGLVTADYEKEIMIGEGVYANGKRYTRTIVRANGTEITGVWGWDAIDTMEAAYDYVRSKYWPWAVPIIATGVSIATAAIAWGHRKGKI